MHLLELSGKLCRRSCFTRTLESDHHDDGNLTLGAELQLGIFLTHHRRKFFFYDFNYGLSGTQGRKYFFADGLFLYLGNKVFYQLEIYIRFQKSHTDFF